MYHTDPKSSRHGGTALKGAGQIADDEIASRAWTEDAARPRFERLASGYLAELTDVLANLDLDAILRIVERLRVARDAGRTIFIAGNGGSAATASHWVNDLAKATKRSGRPAIRVIGLVDNVSWLTALANDEGYDRVFAGQLENFAEPGDVLAVISASGNSPNVLRAVDEARNRGAVTIGLVGFDGGALRQSVDECLWVETPKGAYGVVESAHSVACDIVTTCLIGDTVAEPLLAPR
jgi:D-sedoheptulose 7-phosphate isomerase